MIAFITSIRHPHNSNDYGQVLRLLEQSLRSVCQQSNDNFEVIVVCNEVPDLPFRHSAIRYVGVDFPAPSQTKGPHTGMDAVRLDKGTKYAVGLAAAKDPDYVFFFDADDFVHRDIVDYCLSRPPGSGFYIDRGYVLPHGTAVHYDLRNFYRWCGTCNILRYDLIKPPASITVNSSQQDILEAMGKDYVFKILGAHPFTVDHFRTMGNPLEPINFPAAMYVRGTGENHADALMKTSLPRIVTPAMCRDFGVKVSWSPVKLLKDYVLEFYRAVRWGMKDDRIELDFDGIDVTPETKA